MNFHYRKFKKDTSRSDISVPVIGNGSDNNSNATKEQEIGSKASSRFKGCPKGTTKASKFLLKDTLTAAKNEIAQIYSEAKSQASHNGRRLEDGWLQKVVDAVEKKRGIKKTIPISLKTIHNRVNLLCCVLKGRD